MIQIVVGVRVIVAFGKSVNEYARVRGLKLDGRVGSVMVVNGQEGIAYREMMLCIELIYSIWPSGCVREARIITLRLDFITAIEDVIANDRVDLDASEEAASCLEGPEDE